MDSVVHNVASKAELHTLASTTHEIAFFTDWSDATPETYGSGIIVGGFDSSDARIFYRGYTKFYTGYFRTNMPEIVWTEYATATKPAVYDFPFVAGITPMQKSIYWKTQDGEVMVILNCSSAVNITNGMSIGTLPEGYRPNWALSTLCNLTFSDNSRALVGVTVDISGSVNLWSSLIGGQKSAMYMDFAPIRFVAA